MADRVKGITVVLGGDTTGLNKALSGTNKEIKSTQAQLKDVERLLKLDPTNTKLLEQRQRLLADAVGETKTKLDTLKQAEKQVQEQFKQGKVSQQQYDGLQREIAETQQELKQLEQQASKSNAALSAISAGADKVATSSGNVSRATAPATAAIVGLGAVAFNAASDMVESQNKVEVAFGESADVVKEFADSALQSYGIAEGTALDMAATFGDMGTSMGLAREDAADMATSLVGLAGDLASFKNIGIEQATTALNGVFTGETESLKQLGVVMTQTNLLQFALEQGFVDDAKSAEELESQQIALEKAQAKYTEAVQKHGKSSLEAREAAVKVSDAEEKLNEKAKVSLDTLSEAEKVQLRYAYVMDATKNAQGDFANTSDQAANSMRIMKESAKEASAEFGMALLPVITPIIQKVTELIQWFGSLDESQKKTILTVAALIAAISPVAGIISAISTAISFLAANPIVLLIAAIVALVTLIAVKGEEIKAWLTEFDAWLQGVFLTDWTELFGPVLGEYLNAFFANVQNIWNAIMEIFTGVIDFIRGVFTGDWERAWQGVQTIFKGIFDGLVAIAKAPINGIIGLLNMAINAINELINGLNSLSFDVPEWVPFLGGKSWGFNLPNLPNIPYLAKGGTVLSGSAIVGEAGPELLTVGPGGTRVQPLTNTGGAVGKGFTPVTVGEMNFYGYTPQQSREMAREINRELGRLLV